MATQPYMMFQTQFTVATGGNDQITFEESAGGGPVMATIAAGTYWLADLLTAIGSAMNAASPNGQAYTASVDGNGTVTISSNGAFRLYLLSTTTRKLLTGGDVDDDGTTLASGQQGWGHVGWQVYGVVAPYATEYPSDTVPSGCWYPTEPPKEYIGHEYSATVGVASAVGGQTVHADYTGRAVRPDLAHPVNRYSMTFDFQASASREWFLMQCWPLWKDGRTVRMWPDKADAGVYLDMVLAEETCRDPDANNRRRGYDWWAMTLHFLREVT